MYITRQDISGISQYIDRQFIKMTCTSMAKQKYFKYVPPRIERKEHAAV